MAGRSHPFKEKAMNSKKSVFLAMGLALLAAQLFTAPANAKHRTRQAYHRHQHQQTEAWQYYPLRRAIDGVLVDRNGWRQAGSWHNGCHDLLYLHSMFACSVQGG
jgi:hypothetical protein